MCSRNFSWQGRRTKEDGSTLGVKENNPTMGDERLALVYLSRPSPTKNVRPLALPSPHWHLERPTRGDEGCYYYVRSKGERSSKTKRMSIEPRTSLGPSRSVQRRRETQKDMSNIR